MATSTTLLNNSHTIDLVEDIGVEGYDPNWVEGSIFDTFVDENSLDLIMVTADLVQQGLQVEHPSMACEVVGNPSTSSWRVEAHQVNETELRKTLVGNDTRPIILYAGGYGDGYVESVTMWAVACRTLGQEYNLLFSIHPGHNGSVELEIFEKVGVADIVQFVPDNISLSQAATVSNQLTSQQSTACVQSLYIGVPSGYLNPPGSTFSNVA